MQEVCKQTGKSLSQIILRWHIQNGVIPIFNTSTLEHLRDNMDVFDFQLTDNQMKIIVKKQFSDKTLKAEVLNVYDLDGNMRLKYFYSFELKYFKEK